VSRQPILQQIHLSSVFMVPGKHSLNAVIGVLDIFIRKFETILVTIFFKYLLPDQLLIMI
jgi:hypothetical protein